ncbi:MAG: exodeoxyribonuclease VII small subunit [Clostridiaceae bacterium]|nr:exodeoxyribonuclease VII small subunit [Clostridiaceae bacterium]
MEPDNISELSYEEAVSELEKIIRKLENGQVGLEESLKLYSKGAELAKYCSDQLAEAEKKLMILSRNSEGEWTESKFDADETDGRVSN